MKIKKYYLLSIIILAAFLLNSCAKKEVPQEVDGKPIFFTEGNIGADSVNLYAGKKSYYMFTDQTKDSHGVTELTGNLRMENCLSCGEELTLIVRDNTIRVGAISDIGTLLHTGTYQYRKSFLSATPNLQNVEEFNFTAYQDSLDSYSYYWNFGDSTISTQQNPIHVFYHQVPHNVCLTVSAPGAVSKTICNTIAADSNCRIQFSNNANINNEISFILDAANGDYTWNFGDSVNSYPSNLNTLQHIYSNAGVYRVIVNPTLPLAGCNIAFSKDVKTIYYQGNELVAAFNYGYQTIQVNINPLADSALGKVAVKYTSPNGKKYISYHANIPNVNSSNQLTVTQATPYQNNTSGLKTYKIEGNLKVWMYNESNSNDSLMLNLSRFSLGLGYP